MSLLVTLITLGIWVYLLVARGRYWQSGPTLACRTPSGHAKIAVVIPARDEADGIGRSLASLLAQDYPGSLAIVVVDDNSSDGTGSIVAALAAGDSRLTLVQGKPLQPGWSGKLWAVSQGLQHQAARTADYILLTDGDIFHAPNHVSRLVAKAETGDLDMVSEMVRLHCATFAERALIPAFVYFFEMLYPFAWVNAPDNRMAAAAGGTMLVRGARLREIGGVDAIRHNLIDDVALAREAKRGGRIWLGHSETAYSLRIYEEPRDVWQMIARTAYEQLNHSPVLLVLTCLGMVLTWLAPPLLVLRGHWYSIFGLISWCLMAYSFQPTLRRYHRAPWWGFALPLIGLFYVAATIGSAVRHYRGQGGSWKNRVYPESATAP